MLSLDSGMWKSVCAFVKSEWGYIEHIYAKLNCFCDKLTLKWYKLIYAQCYKCCLWMIAWWCVFYYITLYIGLDCKYFLYMLMLLFVDDVVVCGWCWCLLMMLLFVDDVVVCWCWCCWCCCLLIMLLFVDDVVAYWCCCCLLMMLLLVDGVVACWWCCCLLMMLLIKF